MSLANYVLLLCLVLKSFLKVREREINLPVADSTQMSAMARAEPSRVKNQELHSGLLLGWQGLQHLSHLSLLFADN